MIIIISGPVTCKAVGNQQDLREADFSGSLPGDYRIALEYPAFETAKQDKNTVVSVFVHDQRRTDAFALIWSRSVKDNVPVDGKFLNAGFYLAKRN